MRIFLQHIPGKLKLWANITSRSTNYKHSISAVLLHLGHRKTCKVMVLKYDTPLKICFPRLRVILAIYGKYV